MLTGQASQELRATVSVSLIMAVRMLGLFMILPIFSVQGLQYDGATVASVGLALGIYGLTQACCQIPFGLSLIHI